MKSYWKHDALQRAVSKVNAEHLCVHFGDNTFRTLCQYVRNNYAKAFAVEAKHKAVWFSVPGRLAHHGKYEVSGNPCNECVDAMLHEDIKPHIMSEEYRAKTKWRDISDGSFHQVVPPRDFL